MAERNTLRAAIRAHRNAWEQCNGTNPGNVRPDDLALWAVEDGSQEPFVVTRDQLEEWILAYANLFDAGSMTTDEDMVRLGVLADLRQRLDSLEGGTLHGPTMTFGD